MLNHYVARTSVGKRAVSIRLKCLLVQFKDNNLFCRATADALFWNSCDICPRSYSQGRSFVGHMVTCSLQQPLKTSSSAKPAKHVDD